VVDEDALNMQIRKFLKVVGVTSQREIEAAVRAAESAGRLPAGAPIEARVTLSVPALDLEHHIDGKLELD